MIGFESNQEYFGLSGGVTQLSGSVCTFNPSYPAVLGLNLGQVFSGQFLFITLKYYHPLAFRFRLGSKTKISLSFNSQQPVCSYVIFVFGDVPDRCVQSQDMSDGRTGGDGQSKEVTQVGHTGDSYDGGLPDVQLTLKVFIWALVWKQVHYQVEISAFDKVNDCIVYFRNFMKSLNSFFLKMGHSWPLFSLFSSFQYTIDRKLMFNINKFLQRTGF